MSERLTPSALARKLGVSRQAIYNLQERGILPRDTDGKLDVLEATATIAANLHPAGKAAAAAGAEDTRAGQGINPRTMDYATAKTLRELAEAQIAQIKLAEMQGKLAPVADLEDALRAAHLAAREWLRGEARPVAEECAGQPADTVEQILQRTFDAFLIRLATWQGEGLEDEDEEDDPE